MSLGQLVIVIPWRRQAQRVALFTTTNRHTSTTNIAGSRLYTSPIGAYNVDIILPSNCRQGPAVLQLTEIIWSTTRCSSSFSAGHRPSAATHYSAIIQLIILSDNFGFHYMQAFIFVLCVDCLLSYRKAKLCTSHVLFAKHRVSLLFVADNPSLVYDMTR